MDIADPPAGEQPGITRRVLIEGIGATALLAVAGIPLAPPAAAAGNGQLDLATLVQLPWTYNKFLEPNAAAAFIALDAQFLARFGRDIGVTDAYRDLAEQIRLKALKPNLAATPGKSNHGWGLAVDLGTGIDVFGTDQHDWMRQNAARFDWHHPAWAQQGGSRPEPWHWEYRGNTSTDPDPEPDPVPDPSEGNMLHTVIICDLNTGAEYGSTAVIDPVNGWTRTSTGLGPRSELQARTAIANALGFPVVEKHVDQNGWVMAEQRYKR